MGVDPVSAVTWDTAAMINRFMNNKKTHPSSLIKCKYLKSKASLSHLVKKVFVWLLIRAVIYRDQPDPETRSLIVFIDYSKRALHNGSRPTSVIY